MSVSQTTIEVKGMTCGHCKSAVEGALTELEGISQAEADLATGQVKVAFEDSQVSLSEMHEAVEDQGYDVVS